MFGKRVFFEKSGDVGDGNGGGETPPNSDENDAPIEFDSWLKEQPAKVVEAYETHVKGLKSALVSERTSRQDFEKQLRDLAKKAEAGSESQAELVKMADKVSESQKRSDFYESAHAAGVTNLKLAYLIAVQDDLFSSRGDVNFEKMRVDYPELFGVSARKSKTNAGEGDSSTQPRRGMNDFIRAASGR